MSDSRVTLELDKHNNIWKPNGILGIPTKYYQFHPDEHEYIPTLHVNNHPAENLVGLQKSQW